MQEGRAILLEHQIFKNSSLHPLEINEHSISYYVEARGLGSERVR